MLYISIGINLIIVLLYNIRFGIGTGFRKTTANLISLAITITILNSIKNGSLKARIFQGVLSFSGSVYGMLTIVSLKSKLGSVALFFMYILVIYYTACGAFLLFSPQINAISKYIKLHKSVEWLFNWSGKCIGYRDKDILWSYDGSMIGKFVGNEIFSTEGRYIGELYISNNRLCFDNKKADKSIGPFEDKDKNYKFDKLEDTSSIFAYNQYQDFLL